MTKALTKMTQEELSGYIGEQMALFKSKGLDPYRAMTHEIKPTGKFLPNGREIYSITPRKYTLDIKDWDLDGHARSIKASEKLPSEKMSAREETADEKFLRDANPYAADVSDMMNGSY